MKRLYIDMDNVLVDFELAVAKQPVEIMREYEGRLDEIPGIFGQMLAKKVIIWQTW